MRRIALSILLTALIVPVFAAPAYAGPGEASFVSLINSSRAANGLPALATMGTLTSHGRKHSAEMAASGGIYHSSKSELRGLATGWESYGENVGRGPNDPSALHSAFMSSSGHRNNILGDYTHVGVGTFVTDEGILYVTVVFMRFPSSSTTTTTVAPTTTTTPTSNPTTTTTTAPEAAPKAAAPVSTPAPAPAPAPTTTTTTTVPSVDPSTVPGLSAPDFASFRIVSITHWSQPRMGWVISR